jgi:hypothetical protein
MNKKYMEKANPKASDSAALASAKSSPKKRASAGSNEQVPKMACTTKFCQHCKTNGGLYMTHNTKDLRTLTTADRNFLAPFDRNLLLLGSFRFLTFNILFTWY